MYQVKESVYDYGVCGDNFLQRKILKSSQVNTYVELSVSCYKQVGSFQDPLVEQRLKQGTFGRVE